jgi:hypothetical protein
VRSTDFRLVAGDDLVQGSESSRGKTRHFCGRCGSPLFARDPALPDHVRIRLGSLDGDPGVRPSFHWMVESKAPWFEITDGLPQLNPSA